MLASWCWLIWCKNQTQSNVTANQKRSTFALKYPESQFNHTSKSLLICPEKCTQKFAAQFTMFVTHDNLRRFGGESTWTVHIQHKSLTIALVCRRTEKRIAEEREYKNWLYEGLPNKYISIEYYRRIYQVPVVPVKVNDVKKH